MIIEEEKINDELFSITVYDNENNECQIDVFDSNHIYPNCLYTNNFELNNLSDFLTIIKKYSDKYKGIVFELDFVNEKSVNDIKKLKSIGEQKYYYEF